MIKNRLKTLNLTSKCTRLNFRLFYTDLKTVDLVPEVVQQSLGQSGVVLELGLAVDEFVRSLLQNLGGDDQVVCVSARLVDRELLEALANLAHLLAGRAAAAVLGHGLHHRPDAFHRRRQMLPLDTIALFALHKHIF